MLATNPRSTVSIIPPLAGWSRLAYRCYRWSAKSGGKRLPRQIDGELIVPQRVVPQRDFKIICNAINAMPQVKAVPVYFGPIKC